MPIAAATAQEFNRFVITTDTTNIINPASRIIITNAGASTPTVIPNFNATGTTTIPSIISVATSTVWIFDGINSYFANCQEPVYGWVDGVGWTSYATVAQFWSGTYTNVQAAKLISKPNPKPVRSAIKKGLKLMTGLGFGDEIKLFMGGSGIEVSHPDSDFKFVLTKNRSILDATRYPGISTPYQLELYTKTNVFVSRLCVYMEKTPMLDQILGMLMFVKSGDEEAILRKANYPSLTGDMQLRDELSQKYPHLREKLMPSTDQIMMGGYLTGDANGIHNPAP